MSLRIAESNVEIVTELSLRIPEFENPHEKKEYEKRLAGRTHLILVAFLNEEPVGFKIGYDKFQDGTFYSWMGGVLPQFRRQAIARALAEYQEHWAKRKGFKKIIFKTRNCHKSMLIFSLRNNFNIIGVEHRDPVTESRILLAKDI